MSRILLFFLIFVAIFYAQGLLACYDVNDLRALPTFLSIYDNSQNLEIRLEASEAGNMYAVKDAIIFVNKYDRYGNYLDTCFLVTGEDGRVLLDKEEEKSYDIRFCYYNLSEDKFCAFKECLKNSSGYIVENYDELIAIQQCNSATPLSNFVGVEAKINEGNSYIVFPLQPSADFYLADVPTEINTSNITFCYPIVLALAILIGSLIMTGNNPFIWFNFDILKGGGRLITPRGLEGKMEGTLAVAQTRKSVMKEAIKRGAELVGGEALKLGGKRLQKSEKEGLKAIGKGVEEFGKETEVHGIESATAQLLAPTIIEQGTSLVKTAGGKKLPTSIQKAAARVSEIALFTPLGAATVSGVLGKKLNLSSSGEGRLFDIGTLTSISQQIGWRIKTEKEWEEWHRRRERISRALETLPWFVDENYKAIPGVEGWKVEKRKQTEDNGTLTITFLLTKKETSDKQVTTGEEIRKRLEEIGGQLGILLTVETKKENGKLTVIIRVDKNSVIERLRNVPEEIIKESSELERRLRLMGIRNPEEVVLSLVAMRQLSEIVGEIAENNNLSLQEKINILSELLSPSSSDTTTSQQIVELLGKDEYKELRQAWDEYRRLNQEYGKSLVASLGLLAEHGGALDEKTSRKLSSIPALIWNPVGNNFADYMFRRIEVVPSLLSQQYYWTSYSTAVSLERSLRELSFLSDPTKYGEMYEKVVGIIWGGKKEGSTAQTSPQPQEGVVGEESGESSSTESTTQASIQTEGVSVKEKTTASTGQSSDQRYKGLIPSLVDVILANQTQSPQSKSSQQQSQLLPKSQVERVIKKGGQLLKRTLKENYGGEGVRFYEKVAEPLLNSIKDALLKSEESKESSDTESKPESEQNQSQQPSQTPQPIPESQPSQQSPQPLQQPEQTTPPSTKKQSQQQPSQQSTKKSSPQPEQSDVDESGQ